MIHFKMMCIQPIRINPNIYTDVIDNEEFSTRIIDYFDGHKFNIEWLDNFTNKYRKFRNFKPIKLPQNIPKITSIVSDFDDDDFKVGEELSLTTFFRPNDSNIALLYDHRLVNFFILYEFSFSMQREILLKALNYSTQNNEKTDLYNSIRRMLVKEDRGSKISKWGESVRNILTSQVINIIGCNLNKTISNDYIAMIGKNTGNITFYFETSNDKELQKSILNCNSGAEQIKRTLPPVMENDNICYNFSGRFHSIISSDTSYYYRYFPIQFHMQFMWFIIGFYLEILESLNDDINSKNNTKFLKEKITNVDLYVGQIQFLIMYNEKFKLTIEQDHELILSKIEKNWNIEKSLSNAAQYISMFKEYIAQRHTQKQQLESQKQNTILFIISCVQIIALLSVWADYISITTPKNILNRGPLVELFGDPSTLITFNIWAPICLTFVILIVAVLGFLKKK